MEMWRGDLYIKLFIKVVYFHIIICLEIYILYPYKHTEKPSRVNLRTAEQGNAHAENKINNMRSKHK